MTGTIDPRDVTDAMELGAVVWPARRLGEALAALASAVGFTPRLTPDPGMPPQGQRAGETDALAAVNTWLESLAACMQIEVAAVESNYADLPATLAAMAPALVKVGDGYLAVLASSKRWLRVLPPSLAPARIDLGSLHRALTGHLRQRPAAHVDKWLAAAQVPAKRAARAREALLAQLVADRPIGGIWLLRPDLGSGFGRLLRLRRVPQRTALFLAASVAQVALGIAAWYFVAQSPVKGVLESGWILAWALLSLSALPLQLLATWVGGLLTLDVAGLLKQRLLCGALRLPPDEIRVRGSGELLAMVSESEAVESAGLTGALRVVMAAIQLISAAAVLRLGANGGTLVLLLAGWTALMAGLAWACARRRAAWTRERFIITNNYVENVVGNRTRVAQQAPQLHHMQEDALLARYQASARRLDRISDLLLSVPARGWLAVALLGLMPAVLANDTPATLILVTVGGMLQAQIAFTTWITSLTAVLGAAVSWRAIAPLFAAAARREPPGVPHAVAGRPRDGDVLLEARRLSFRYDGQHEPALRDCDLVVRTGDRWLVEGPSGGGKSTLAAVLCGLRPPSSGLTLLRGLDPQTLGGEPWRQRIAGAPQFHENHILSGTLAFNLLLGRGWPASKEDRAEAERVCQELDLGPLIERMPAGLDQVVGETGWQLSHGERSRVFLARALLQRAEVIVLDESFGSLDPIAVERCVSAVLARAPAVLVIAHP